MTGSQNIKTSRRVLLIGYGNPGRLDDGLGPALAAEVEKLGLPGLDVDSDYQLTVEHASDVAEHDVVIFADADVSGPEPFAFREIQPADVTAGFSTHAVEAADVLGLARKLFGAWTRGFALGIRGYRFNHFGEGLSDKAKVNLTAAVAFVEEAVRKGDMSALIVRKGDEEQVVVAPDVLIRRNKEDDAWGQASLHFGCGQRPPWTRQGGQIRELL